VLDSFIVSEANNDLCSELLIFVFLLSLTFGLDHGGGLTVEPPWSFSGSNPSNDVVKYSPINLPTEQVNY